MPETMIIAIANIYKIFRIICNLCQNYVKNKKKQLSSFKVKDLAVCPKWNIL